jgi:hypothetical protein
MKRIAPLMLLFVFAAFITVKAQNVGISNTLFTPQSYLHVHQPNVSGNLIQMTNSTSGNGSNTLGLVFSVNGASYTLRNYQVGFMSFQTNASDFTFHDGTAERVRFQNGGRVGIGTAAPHTSALLHVNATNRGILIPNVALTATNTAGPVATPQTSLLVYNTATASAGATYVYPGFYYNAGTTAVPNWRRLMAGGSGGDGWLTTGNYGTTPANNWLGTNDAQDFAVRSNNTERMRILSGGNVLVNHTTALLATAAFESAMGGTFTTAIFGIGNGGAASIFGENQNIDSDALWAHNTAVNGAGAGFAIWATSGQLGGSTIAVGLQSMSYFSGAAISAIADVGAGGTRGVLAQSNSAGGVAVQGQTSGTNGLGVLGINNAGVGTGSGRGVHGQTTQGGATAAGVYALNAHAAGSGIIAVNSAVAGNNIGDALTAQTSQRDGFGTWGHNGNATGTGAVGSGNNQTANFLTGGSGGAFTGSTTGAYGKATGATGTGVVGVGNNLATASTLVGGSGGAFSGTVIGVYGIGTNVGNDIWGGYFNSGNANSWAYVGGRTGGTNYKIYGAGSVSTIVDRPDGSKATMFCPEAPEILFQDYGHGQLVNGRVSIELDPILVNNIYVDEQHPLKVFIQLEGDCNGVYVTNKSRNGFEVVELQGGTSNVPFTWTIVATRADARDNQGNVVSKHVGVRFPDSPVPPATVEQKSNERKQEIEIIIIEPAEAKEKKRPEPANNIEP